MSSLLSYIQPETGRVEILAQYGWKLIIFWESELVSPRAEEIVLARLRSNGLALLAG